MMRGAKSDITKAVGNTPIVKLNKVTEGLAADIYVKCEYLNPGGSHKDRVAQHDQRRGGARAQAGRHDRRGDQRQHRRGARDDGRDARLQVRLRDAGQDEPGEDLDPPRVGRQASCICPTAVEPEDPRSYYQVAKRIADETPNCFYANQYHNPDNPGAPLPVHGPRDLGPVRPRARRARHRPGHRRHHQRQRQVPQGEEAGIKLVGVDPVGSLYYDFIKTGASPSPSATRSRASARTSSPHDQPQDHRRDRARRRQGVLLDDARSRAARGPLRRRLGRRGRRGRDQVREARAGKKENILVMLPDGASKYISKIFNDDWMRENGFLEDEGKSFGTVARRAWRPPARPTPSCRWSPS
jgi:cystathionine beta-synthase